MRFWGLVQVSMIVMPGGDHFLSWFVRYYLPYNSVFGRVVSSWSLSVDIYPRSILPMSPLNSDSARGHPGDLYASVGGPHHFDGNPTTYIAACYGLGLPTLGGEAAGQAFQHGLCLSNQEAVHLDDEGG